MNDNTLASDLRAGMPARTRPLASGPLAHDGPASAVSWAAIIAGAAGAAALSLILLILGVGLGLSSVSPFANSGASTTTFGVSTIVWITFTQLAAAGIGGYLAGRLRTRWAATHVDEVYFRDTAHGFLAWSVATLATAAMLTSAIGSIVGTGASAAGSVVGGAAPMGAEAGRIFASGLESGALPADDVKYLGQQVSQRTGQSLADAERRVNDAFAHMKANADQAKAEAREAADKARKASAHAALWLFISLLVGAFVASLSATFGGRQRDLV
jgi:hypothetical protein